MIIGLLLFLAVIAGATCVWLFLRGSQPLSVAVSAEHFEALSAMPEREPPPENVPTLRPAGGVGLDALKYTAGPGALPERDIYMRLYQLGLGPLALEPAPEQELRVLTRDAQLNYAELATDPRYALRRPLLLPQLLRAVNDSSSSQQQLVKIIAQDPALAGNLLKVANSPAYRVREKPVESLERAVALLGTSGLHSLISVALVQPIFKVNQAGFAKFPQVVWDHTFKAAMAAEARARDIDESERFAAQLLALTMGLGAIVTFRMVVDRCQTLLGGKVVHPATLAALLESQLPLVAARVGAGWELSERMQAALQERLPLAMGQLPPEPSMLGQSLVFGRRIAALAQLRGQEDITPEVVRDSLLDLGPLPADFEALWDRLVEKDPAA